MKILYDHQIFTQQYYGGISRYFCELMDWFDQEPDISYTLALRYSYNENLHEKPSISQYWSGRNKFFSNRTFQFIQQVTHVDILNYLHINKNESIQLLKKQDFDLFHPTYYDPYFLKYLGKKPFVLTVYDMIHELYPTFFSSRDPTKLWKKQLIEKAEVIIAISNNTKNDIIRLTNVDPDRITVIYLGNPFNYPIPYSIDELNHEIFLFEKSYLLFVGNRSGYKNFSFFISSLTNLLKKDENLHVYCAGGGPFTLCELNLLNELNILLKVHYVKINDIILKYLYKNAQAFVFPSLYEGFGLPILEAFSCGCPTILSNSSSLYEIAADAACYIDPTNTESIINGIQSVLSDPHYREDLVKKGYERLRFFSWNKAAKETKCVYNYLL